MASPGSFTQLLTTLEQADFFIGVLPFLLTYLVFYAVLENVPVIQDKDNFPALIAIIFAFFTSFFIVQNPAYQAFFVNYLGTLTVGIIGMLGLFTVIGLTGLEAGQYFTRNAFAVLAVIVAAIAFTVSGGFGALTLGASSGVLATVLAGFEYLLNTGLIWGVVIVGILAFTMSEGREQGQTPWLYDALFRNGPERNRPEE